MRTPDQTPITVPDLAPTELYNGGYLPAPPEIAERLTLSFRERVECGLVSNQEMAAHLRDSLLPQEGEEVTSEAIKDASTIMHRFTMQGIMEQQQTGDARFKAYDLLNRTTEEAQVKEASFVKDSGFVGTYYAARRHMDIDEAVFRPDHGPRNITFKHKNDQNLLFFADVVAHEDGHAISAGATTYLAERYERARAEGLLDEKHGLTERRLQKRIDTVITGNKEADIRAEEERLAEGVGSVGMGVLMRTLGYSEKAINKYLGAMHSGQDYNHKHGRNQIDVLHKVTATKGPHHLVREDADDLQKSPAILGYARRLSPEEVVATLAEAEELAETTVPLSSDEWFDAAKLTKDPAVAKEITKMRAKRHLKAASNAVIGQSGSIRRKVTGAVAALAIMAGPATGAVVAHELQKLTPEEVSAQNEEAAYKSLIDEGYAVRVIKGGSPYGDVRIFGSNEVDATGRKVVNFYTK
jgi:hypothetical protein